MKKFAKMSLVAALAVTGTVASAQPLAEAIKNVDVSGSVVYRYNDYNEDNKGEGLNNNQNYYKAVLNLKAKANDDVTVNTSVAANNNFGAWDTRTTGDSNVSIELTKVNFAYTGVKNTTIIAGKQGIPTPWTVASDTDSAEHTGTGILALSTWGPVTFAAAYFNQQNLDVNNGNTSYAADNSVSVKDNFDGAEDIATIGIMGSFGPVALDAWYLSLMDEEEGAQADVSFDSYTVGASTGFDVSGIKLGLKARYTNLEFDEDATGVAVNGADSSADNSLWYAYLTAKTGIFGASVGYGATDEDGGLAALDNDAKSGFQGWNTNLNGERDADMIKVNLNVQALSSLNIALNYNDMDSDYNDERDAEEIYTQITYKMSKNFGGYFRLGQHEIDGEDSDVARLQIQYTY